MERPRAPWAREYPDLFEWLRDGDEWRWLNKPLQIDQKLVFIDDTAQPGGPMEFATRQTQGHFALFDQRDENLWMDAGMMTTQADWSPDFDIGMNFCQWHAPSPRDLPGQLATCTGFIRNRPMTVDDLSRFDDGAPTSPVILPD